MSYIFLLRFMTLARMQRKSCSCGLGKMLSTSNSNVNPSQVNLHENEFVLSLNAEPLL